jgi:uncharacterized protein (TIGR02594 family)
MASSFLPGTIGDILGHGSNNIGIELARAGLQGLANGVINEGSGGDFWTGFATGAVSSLAGSGLQALKSSDDMVRFGAGFAGAGTAALMHGDAMSGFWQGYGIADANHVGGEKGKFVNSKDHPHELSAVTTTGKLPEKFKSAPWMIVAVSQLGVKEATFHNDGPEVAIYQKSAGLKSGQPWCGAFANWTFNQVGINEPKAPGRAYSWKTWGQSLSRPAYGAIAVMNYSHVAFVAGLNNDGRIVLLGGNQSPGAVTLSSNSKNAVKSYRYPSGYVPNYNLPNYNLHGKSLNLNSTR